jgi:GT2 family glycosyltransferase
MIFPRCRFLTLCVNYHRDDETLRFVQGLLSQVDAVDQRVIVVDNSVPPLIDGPLSRLSQEDERASVVRPGRNLGYFGGAALGLQCYCKSAEMAEWIIVCNTDIEFSQEDFLCKLDLFHGGPHASAVVAPAIIASFSGCSQNPHMRSRPTRVRMHFYKWIYRLPPLFWVYETLSFIKRALFHGALPSTGSEMLAEGPTTIYSPHGAFIAFHRRYFEAGGSLNHGVFLFGEETFVAETCRRLGLAVQYDHRLKIIHREHGATGHLRESRKLHAEAAAYCADTFFSGERT